jgi:hypothetical protein
MMAPCFYLKWGIEKIKRQFMGVKWLMQDQSPAHSIIFSLDRHDHASGCGTTRLPYSYSYHNLRRNPKSNSGLRPNPRVNPSTPETAQPHSAVGLFAAQRVSIVFSLTPFRTQVIRQRVPAYRAPSPVCHAVIPTPRGGHSRK